MVCGDLGSDISGLIWSDIKISGSIHNDGGHLGKFTQLISSPEPKVLESDQAFLITSSIVCSSVNVIIIIYIYFTFSNSSPWLIGQFQLN